MAESYDLIVACNPKITTKQNDPLGTGAGFYGILGSMDMGPRNKIMEMGTNCGLKWVDATGSLVAFESSDQTVKNDFQKLIDVCQNYLDTYAPKGYTIHIIKARPVGLGLVFSKKQILEIEKLKAEF